MIANILEKQCKPLLYLLLDYLVNRIYSLCLIVVVKRGNFPPLVAKPRRCSGVVRRGSSQRTGGTKHLFIGCRPRSICRLCLYEWRRFQLTADKIYLEVRNILILRGIRFLTTVPNFHQRGVFDRKRGIRCARLFQRSSGKLRQRESCNNSNNSHMNSFLWCRRCS